MKTIQTSQNNTKHENNTNITKHENNTKHHKTLFGSYGLMVMTADFESASLGSIPSKTFPFIGMFGKGKL